MKPQIPQKQLVSDLLALKKKKNAVLLAHYYQDSSIQDISDFLGDSLYLAKKAQETTADIIILAGVHFMAETAKILNPNKKVLLPDPNAGCSLAASCPPEAFKKFIAHYPDAVVVSYVNCSAEIKTLSAYCCTSSNAVQVINSIPKDKQIIFAPDKNLGHFLQKQTGRKLILWDGFCEVHEAFSLERIIALHQQYPKAKFIAHPESEHQILKIAQFIGSTTALLEFVQKDDATSYIVATESGIIHQMQKACPKKIFLPAPVEDDTCACSECAYMKLNTVEKIYHCLLKEAPEIKLSASTISAAAIPLQRMMELS
jgi:quinolinate synthase